MFRYSQITSYPVRIGVPWVPHWAALHAPPPAPSVPLSWGMCRRTRRRFGTVLVVFERPRAGAIYTCPVCTAVAPLKSGLSGEHGFLPLDPFLADIPSR